MPVLLNYPLFHADDDIGAPLTGGLLYSYIAGSSTAKATYTTRAMGTANANPVVLNSRGEAVIYGSGLYKLILKTSAGVTIWTQDNIELGPGQGAYSFFVDPSEVDQGAAGAGASLYDILTALGSSKKATVYFPHNGTGNTTTYTVSTTYDASAYTNVTFEFENGAVLAVATGKTLTLPSPANLVAKANEQIFSGAGTVAFNSGGVVYPDWWAVNTSPGTTDMHAAIEAADTSQGSNEGTISFISGAYKSSGDITFDSSIYLHFDPNSSLQPDLAMTVTIYNPNNISNTHQIFSGSGSIAFTTGGEAYLSWFASLANAITALAATTSILIMNKAQTISSALTQNANSVFKWEANNGLLTFAAGGSLTLNGLINAHDSLKLFVSNSLTETAIFSSTSGQDKMSVKWWGAVANNVSPFTDDALAFDCAIKSANANHATLYLPPGTYRVKPGGITTAIQCPVYGPRATVGAYDNTDLKAVLYVDYGMGTSDVLDMSTFELEAIIGYEVLNSGHYAGPPAITAITTYAYGLYMRQALYSTFKVGRIAGFFVGLYLDSATADTHIASNQFRIGELHSNATGVYLAGGNAGTGTDTPEANTFWISFMQDHRTASITLGSTSLLSMNDFFIHEINNAIPVGGNQDGIYLVGANVAYNHFKLLSQSLSPGTGKCIKTASATNNVFEMGDTNVYGNVSMDAGNVIIGHGALGDLASYGRSEIWQNVLPASGYWRVGDICWHMDVAGGGSPGWICTTAGIGGAAVWKEMAAVGA